MKSEEVMFKTEDGVEVAGDYYPASGKRAAVLLHMMPATKESWRDFFSKLNEKGFSALAIDLRGHGKSTKAEGGRVLNYEKFSDREHQESIKDVEAAADFLTEKGFDPKSVAFIGASIGANLALRYQAEHSQARCAVLLSPGFDYRGITMEPLAEKIRKNQFVFLVAGGDNDEYSSETAKKLYETLDCGKKLKILENAGHGTNMFFVEPRIMDEIAGVLSDVLQ
ncbi:MAG: alpha/beta fold hydrolase [Parcubacteria group bacterium]|nr:alpha/beta fold hydrolase [Parcubacteria group bacterium]